jgi:hypothetical protein
VRLVKGGPQKVRPEKNPHPPPVRRKTNKMKITTKFLILLIIFGLIATGKKIKAQDITVTGSWFLTIDASDLQAGAGSDLIDTYESASNQVTIDISSVGGNNWRVDVKKVDTNWHSSFHLYVKRTSNGTGSGGGSISGGTSYQEVTDTDQSFFSGNRNRYGINVQLKLSGVSVQIPPDTYITTVYYTVTRL